MRYRCTQCGRTFTPLTGTPQAYSKRQALWPRHAHCISKSLSLRRTAAELGIHLSTAFRWRHRVLQGWLARPRPPLTGVVELVGSFYPDCRKGERHLARPPRQRAALFPLSASSRIYLVLLRDRNGAGLALSLGPGPPGLGRLSAYLKPLLGKACALHTGTHAWFRLFTKCLKLPHLRGHVGARVEDVDPELGVAGPAHIRLRRWLKGFYGVNVRYLDHYLAWFDIRDGMTGEASSTIDRRVA